MPVPKRKTSKARRDQRQSTKFIRPHAITACSNCNHPLVPHEVCSQCGFYKGRKIMTTKLERNLKRGESRRVQQAKKMAGQTQEQDGHSSGSEQSDAR